MQVDYPSPPDPAQTSALQTASNKETAIANANLNRIDQYTPTGSVTYQNVGENEDGTPKYTQTQSLGPWEQAIYDANANTRANVGNIGLQQSTRIGNLLNTPLDLNESQDQKYFDMQRKALDPVWDQRETDMRTRLINQGIDQGSEAYGKASANFSNERDASYNDLYARLRGQATQELMTERSNPINEISALMSGSQVTPASFLGVPQAGVANTDVAGIYNNNFQQRMGIANAQNSSNNAMMGGMAGLGSAFMFSDRRLKTNVQRIGTADNGLPIYSYRYIWGGPVQIGFMADEVEAVAPEAVAEIDGFLAVDYGRAV